MKKIILAVALFAMTGISITANAVAEFDISKICKATISTVMGKAPSIMKIDKIVGGVIYLSYIRQSDRTTWAYRCQIDGAKAIWATDTGRWRTHAMDSKITFIARGGSLKITEKYSDGSSTKKTFTSNQLGG